jgi:hypothetical protein
MRLSLGFLEEQNRNESVLKNIFKRGYEEIG